MDFTVSVPVWAPALQGAKASVMAAYSPLTIDIGAVAVGTGETTEKPQPVVVKAVTLRVFTPVFIISQDASWVLCPESVLVKVSGDVVLFTGLLSHCTPTVGAMGLKDVTVIGFTKV